MTTRAPRQIKNKGNGVTLLGENRCGNNCNCYNQIKGEKSFLLEVMTKTLQPWQNKLFPWTTKHPNKILFNFKCKCIIIRTLFTSKKYNLLNIICSGTIVTLEFKDIIIAHYNYYISSIALLSTTDIIQENSWWFVIFDTFSLLPDINLTHSYNRTICLV